MHQKRGRRHDKPVKDYVSLEWTLIGGPRGPWWGQLTPPWSLWPLRCLPVYSYLWRRISALAFSVCVSMGRCSMPKSVLCGPNLTCSCVWPWTSLWHVHYCTKVSLGGYPMPPYLAQCVLYHKNRENVKCKGSAGGNTPAEPKVSLDPLKLGTSCIMLVKWFSFQLTPNFVDPTARTHTKPLRDLQNLW